MGAHCKKRSTIKEGCHIKGNRKAGIMAVCTAFNVLLLAAACWLFAQADRRARWGPPVHVSVPKNADVGYMRLSEMWCPDSFFESPAYIAYKFMGHIPCETAKSGTDTLQIQRTVAELPPDMKMIDPKNLYEKILWYCEDDGHCIFIHPIMR